MASYRGIIDSDGLGDAIRRVGGSVGKGPGSSHHKLMGRSSRGRNVTSYSRDNAKTSIRGSKDCCGGYIAATLDSIVCWYTNT